MLIVAAHPLLDPAAFVTTLPGPLSEVATLPELQALLSSTAAAPLTSSDAVREAVRALLRHGGFKPSGRSKPSAEYLIRAAGDGSLVPINFVVDVCNVVSLHSGLPISVVDLDRARPPFHVDIAPTGTKYVFNASGQEIDVGGLLCLHDADGPCANAVKDAQRTKTTDTTRRTLSVIWGSSALPERTSQTLAWYRQLLERAGARTQVESIEPRAQ